MAQNNSDRITLIAAVCCGIAGAAVAFIYLSQNQVGDSDVPTTRMVVAARDLPAFVELSVDNDLDTVDVPTTFTEIIEQGYAAEHLTNLEGRRLNRPILAGTPIFFADTVPAAELEITPGKFALSVPAMQMHGVSGLIVPGDRVKVLVTRELPNEQTQRPTRTDDVAQMLREALVESMSMSSTRWQTVVVSPKMFRVLAVDQRLAGDPRQYNMLMSGDPLDTPGYATVTLEVTESEAVEILSASGGGELPVTLLLGARPRPGEAQVPDDF